ncbi:MAG: Na+/H+ antiporter subunit E [Planctomycetota bacterium]
MINKFLLNLFLSVVYVALAGDVSFLTALTGFVIGALTVSLLGRATGRAGYMHRVYGVLRFGVYFVYILTKANLEVAREILTPGFSMTPRIIRYPVDGLSDTEIITLANAISLTPGTLSADVTEDGCTLYIHCMYAERREDAVAALDELKCWLLREVFDHDV